MKFHLYECVIQRGDDIVRGHIVAPSQDRATLVIIEHDEVLGLSHDDFSLERVDKNLPRDRQLGLDTLLNSAPVGFASYCDIGWIAHIAPVQQLKLYCLIDEKADDLFAIAPNIDIAASVFVTALEIPIGMPRMLSIVDGSTQLTEDQQAEVSQLLELGPIGIVTRDENGGWSRS